MKILNVASSNVKKTKNKKLLPNHRWNFDINLNNQKKIISLYMFAKSALTQPSSNAELQKKHEISKKYLKKLLQTSIKVKTRFCIHTMGTTLTKIAKTKKKTFLHKSLPR